ncbi:MAG TPA: ArsR family transcriptional regulator [Pseudonocardiaceae bacterium]|jgi:DNA-binding transcriptional ArsR family regulator|nr:ArsR family transcriptional regulator [Pseudonocardiaceae bacterium]
MISYELSVEDLADTHFGVSPIHETVLSLRVLRDPGRHALLLPWRRSVVDRLGALDVELLLSLVGDRDALPDFLTPRPSVFVPSAEEELARIRATAPPIVRRDLRAISQAGANSPQPPRLRQAIEDAEDAAVDELLDTICDTLAAYWRLAVEPVWPRMRRLLEADMTYRARRLATGGARLLFADIHPNVSWRDGVLSISKMIGSWHTGAAGRGLLLMPSVFAHKPAPPVSAAEPPTMSYPCRGVATLWSAPPPVLPGALVDLLGQTRVRLLSLMDEPLPTVELARRLQVTPSAVSQHLRVMFATGLVNRARDGRLVLYRRSPLGDELHHGPEC